MQIRHTEQSILDMNNIIEYIAKDSLNIAIDYIEKMKSSIELLLGSPRMGTNCKNKNIAVDPWFIVHAGGEDAKIIRTAREVNTYKTEWTIEKIKNAALKFENENGRKAKVACMGLAFKPDIYDLGESPALYIARRLIADGLNVLAVEPNISEHKEFKNLEIETTLDFCGVLN